MCRKSLKYYKTKHPFNEIFAKLRLIYTGEEILDWLHSPQKLLDSQIPYDMIIHGKTDQVLAVVNQLTDGC